MTTLPITGIVRDGKQNGMILSEDAPTKANRVVPLSNYHNASEQDLFEMRIHNFE